MKAPMSVEEQHSSDLFARIRQPAKELGLDALTLAPLLRGIAQDYLLTIPSSTIVTRGSVVKKLQALLDCKPKSLQRQIAALPLEAVTALCRQFPAPGVELRNIDGEADAFSILSPEKVLPAAFKSRTAHRTRAGDDLILRAMGWSVDCPTIDRTNMSSARKGLAIFARDEPDLFREHLASILRRLRDGFQLQDQAGGRNLSLTEGLDAGADWKLANAVLDQIWPMESGKMDFSQNIAARTIIEVTKVYAFHSGQKEIPDKHVIDWGVISHVTTLRHQIHTLNQSILFIEKRKLSHYSADGYSETHLKRSLRFSTNAFYPLLDWRRELERRLAFGDYRPSREEIRRPTGPILRTPNMPRFTKNDGLLKRTFMLIKAARPLRPFEGKTATSNVKSSR